MANLLHLLHCQWRRSVRESEFLSVLDKYYIKSTAVCPSLGYIDENATIIL